MGSGSVGVAALRLGRRFVGNDINPEAVQLAKQRLAELGSGQMQGGATLVEGQPDLLEIADSRP